MTAPSTRALFLLPRLEKVFLALGLLVLVSWTIERLSGFSARRALPRPEVHRHSHPAVALVFDSLDLAEPHGDREPDIHADRGLRLVRAARFRFAQRDIDQREQVRATGGRRGGLQVVHASGSTRVQRPF